MANERRQYSREFKVEAVRLLETSGKSAAAIERELGIGDGCLSRSSLQRKQVPSYPSDKNSRSL